MLNGSPAPMPGALLAFRVLLKIPNDVELDIEPPGFAQLITLKMLNISARNCSDALCASFVVLKTPTSTVLNHGP